MEGQQILILNQDSDDLILTDMYLQNAGFQTTLVSEPSEVLQLLESVQPDVVLIDVPLAEIDSYQVCEEIRLVSLVPIILINEPCEEWEIVKGLNSGADDYVFKPVRPAELIARIQSILRRIRMLETECNRHIYSVGKLVIHLLNREVYLDKRQIVLSNREFDLLIYFMRHVGENVSKERLLNQVWGGEKVLTRTLDIYVQKLRKKLGNPQLIETIWGYGYRFVLPTDS